MKKAKKTSVVVGGRVYLYQPKTNFNGTGIKWYPEKMKKAER
jgi:hypothetical protein